MALSNALFLLTLCSTCLVFCAGSPTRRQFISYSDTETSSSAPARIVASDEVWDDSDDFDLDDDENWIGDAIVTPSSIPERAEYQDYDGERYDDAPKDSGKGDSEDGDDVETQDAEEDETSQLHNGPDEFLFLPSKDKNLMLQMESEKTSPIKVRHTGKNSFSDLSGNLIEDSGDDDKFHGQFEFTVDNDDEDDDTDDNAINASNDDIVIEDTVQPKDSDNNNVEEESKTISNPSNDNNVDDDDDAADNTDDDEEDDDDQLFDSDESQVIYGDHVFLY